MFKTLLHMSTLKQERKWITELNNIFEENTETNRIDKNSKYLFFQQDIGDRWLQQKHIRRICDENLQDLLSTCLDFAADTIFKRSKWIIFHCIHVWIVSWSYNVRLFRGLLTSHGRRRTSWILENFKRVCQFLPFWISSYACAISNCQIRT